MDNTFSILRKIYRKGLVFLSLLSLMLCVNAQNNRDTIRTQQLDEVNINAVRNTKIYEGPAAIQIITAQKISQLPVMQLSDALKYMSGVVVRDYGGTGGMKTISVRGLGSQHTGISYDDLALTDCQTGQIDLGKLSLENVSSLSLIVGADNNIFVPARLLSYSNLLKINTLNTIPENKYGFRVGTTIGLYGMYSAQAAFFNKIVSKKKEHRLLLWNLSADYMRSKGNYPYLLHYGGINDSVSHEIRKNAEINTLNVEGNAIFQIDQTQRLNVKLYYYGSERELPSATIYYNDLSRQKLWNKNAFAQVHYHKYFNPKWAYQANAKFNYDYTRYFDPDYLNNLGYLENKYHQTESYFSNTALFTPIGSLDSNKVLRLLQFALSQDVFYQDLRSDAIDIEKPGRLTSLTSISTSIAGKKWSLSGSLLFTYVHNILHQDIKTDNFYHLSPIVGVNVKFNKVLSMRFFYKNIFRMPTFNDLYYREVGNLNLKPEKTHQWNVGIVLNEAHIAAGKLLVSASVDGYFNIVKDKIVAFPSHNLFSWTMINYGKVYVAGAEFNNFWLYRISSRYNIVLNGNITYQKAVDRTDASGKTYNNQIPYTPLLSGSFSASLRTPWIDLTYSFIASGKRYALPQNIPANEVAGYFDHNITLGHNFDFKKSTISLKLEFLNITNKQYEIIRNYPMQRFGFRAKVVYEFKG